MARRETIREAVIRISVESDDYEAKLRAADNGAKDVELEDFYTSWARQTIGTDLGYSPEVAGAIGLALRRDLVSQEMLELLGLSERRYMEYVKRLVG